nr:hypothetical protein [Modestobacter muralis]
MTLDDRTGYTLWAPPWEEDGEEWQAFLGSTVDPGPDDDPEARPTAVVHLFPSPAALAAFCRTSTDHDLADHPVWPVVSTLGAADLTPDEEHRYDLDGVYDIVAENPDRWAVEELAAVLDVVGRLAECCDAAMEEDEDDDDAETGFEAVADLASRPEAAALGLGIDAFVGRDGEQSWSRLGTAIDELWEDVLEDLDDHLDWSGAGAVSVDDYPSAAEEAESRTAQPADLDDLDDEDADDDLDDVTPAARPAAGSTAAAPAQAATAGIRTIRSGSGLTASPAAVAAAQEFWEAVGILPVELVTPTVSGVTLRCYVEDRARFLGRDGQVFVFPSPVDLARFCAGDERHDLTDIASWPEVADTDVMPLPADEDRYDLTELTEVLAEVASGAGGLVTHAVLVQPAEGALDLAEYAALPRVQQLLGAGSPLGRAVARGDSEPTAPLSAEETPALASAWDDVVADVSTALVPRSDVLR